jgi:hypothetical protein
VNVSTGHWRAWGESHSRYAIWIKSFTPCNYQTHGFAYEGKLLLAVSDYDPTLTEAYIWRNGKIESIDKLHQQIERKEKAWLKHLQRISQKRKVQPANEKA